MPIFANNPGECIEQFREHVASTVQKILGAGALIRTRRLDGLDDDEDAEFFTLSTRQGNSATTVPLETRYGRLYFYLAQELETKRLEEGRKYRLHTRKYWYRLQAEPGDKAQALIRWEYAERKRPHRREAPFHVQSGGRIPCNKGFLNLHRLHVPTGWVSFEEVLRFLVHDLGVAPKCGRRKWGRELMDSEDKFREKFHRRRPPTDDDDDDEDD